MSLEEILKKIENVAKEVADTDVEIVPGAELIAFSVIVSRRLRNWKQQTLADFAGISLSTVERIERAEGVSEASLNKVAVAMGHQDGYFTRPRKPISQSEARAKIEDEWQFMVPVNVERLSKQRHVRELTECQASLVHSGDSNNDHTEQRSILAEWLDLGSHLRTTDGPCNLDNLGIRDFYNDVLKVVQDIEREGVTILCGVMDAPQIGIPEWKVAVVFLCPKSTDPGAINRKIIHVDSRNVALPPPLTP